MYPSIIKQAQKYGLIPRSEASNPLRWVEQSAKSYYKPIVVDPATAAKIFEALSGMELALAIPSVAATGIRISEALGLKWGDVDYSNGQINLRRVSGLRGCFFRQPFQDRGFGSASSAHRSAGRVFTCLASRDDVREAR